MQDPLPQRPRVVIVGAGLTGLSAARVAGRREPGFRNRTAVAASWIWTCLTAQRGTRLITGTSGARHPAMTAAEEAA